MTCPIIHKEILPILKKLPQRDYKTQMVLRRFLPSILGSDHEKYDCNHIKNHYDLYKNEKLQMNPIHEHRWKRKLNKALAKQTQLCIKMVIHHEQAYFSRKFQQCLNIRNTNSCNSQDYKIIGNNLIWYREIIKFNFYL